MVWADRRRETRIILPTLPASVVRLFLLPVHLVTPEGELPARLAQVHPLVLPAAAPQPARDALLFRGLHFSLCRSPRAEIFLLPISILAFGDIIWAAFSVLYLRWLHNRAAAVLLVLGDEYLRAAGRCVRRAGQVHLRPDLPGAGVYNLVYCLRRGLDEKELELDYEEDEGMFLPIVGEKRYLLDARQLHQLLHRHPGLESRLL